MIIIQTALKDTFVTDMSTQFNKGIDANFGQASTLDLFKIVGENKNVKSRAMITINDTIVNGNTFTLKDSLGNSITFIIRTLEVTVDGSVEIDGENKKVKIGLSGANTVTEKRDRFISAINNVNSFNNGLTFDITAYKLDNNKILLQQNKFGISGDTVPVLPNNENSISITNFIRFEHSAILLTYDFQKIYDDHVEDLDKSSFSTSDPAADFKAYIRLTDVGVDSSSPRNFKLRIRPLANDFNEGLGRDIIQFSDIGDANFKTINSLVTPSIKWSTEGMVTIDDIDVSTSFEQEVSFTKGNEDAVFDITDHVYQFLTSARDNNNIGNKTQTFVIDFALENIFDSYTYFVKRLGSRNLSNKYKRPKLEIKIKDKKLESVNYDTKKRFLDNEEVFYLTNLINKKLVNFSSDSQIMKLEYLGNVRETESIRFLRNPLSDTAFKITDSRGQSVNIRISYSNDNDITLEGGNNFYIGLFSLGQGNITLTDAISKISQQIQTKVTDNTLQGLSITALESTIKITNNTMSETDIFEVITDVQKTMIITRNSVKKNIFDSQIPSNSVYNYKGSALEGIKKFTIPSTTISRFESNSTFKAELQNKNFVAVTVKFIDIKSGVEFITKTEDIKFYQPESSEEDLFKKIRVVLDTQQKNISADDSIKTLKFSFIDIARQHAAVNVPHQIISEDLGDVSFSMYNFDSKSNIILNDKTFDDTTLIFNGKHYIANIFASSIYKSLRVGFAFEYTDPLTGLSKKIKDDKLVVRFE